ncbi:MAG: YheC/YheD family protein [Firmicutes bacterium]|nr:YheC/YheD family protein [Bacillota bacterium]
MKTTVTVGLLAPFFAPITGYEEVARDLRVNLVVVTPKKIHWMTRKVEGLVWNGRSWDSQLVSLPKAMYNRFYSSKPQVICSLEKILGQKQIFNHITRFDKVKLHDILVNSELSPFIPPSEPYNPQKVPRYLEKYDALIVKPRRGHLGYKVLLVRRDDHGYHLHQGSKFPTSSYSSLEELLVKLNELVSSDYLLQKFIPFATLEGRIFDLRSLVQKDERGFWTVTGLISRVALSYSYITNISQAIIPGETALKQAFPHADLAKTVKEISIKGAQIAEQSLGSLGEISIDFALDKQGKIWIIELNGKPMKAIFKELGDLDVLKRVYQAPLAYARYLATT